MLSPYLNFIALLARISSVTISTFRIINTLFLHLLPCWILLVLLAGCEVFDPDLLQTLPESDGAIVDQGNAIGSNDAGVVVDSSTVAPVDSSAGPNDAVIPISSDANVDAFTPQDADLTPDSGDAGEDSNTDDQCEPGFDDCDGNPDNGCETSIDDTVAHCGACNSDCDAALEHTDQTICSMGSCQIITCENGWGDCDSITYNGCEHEISVDGPCIPDADCTMYTHESNDYYFCTNASTWSAARVNCQIYPNGDLATISSSAENDFIQTYLTGSSWIGARDLNTEGLWIWDSNGMPFWRGTASGTELLDQYQNWNDSQPDDSTATENCAEIDTDGYWHDRACTDELGFVCEVSQDQCPDDPDKVDPGQCGCGTADTDADNDGFAVCNDSCEDDPSKQDAGQCGCGEPESDTDDDGTFDCIDECPLDPTHTDVCLVFTVSNFDPTPVNWSVQPATTLNCGNTTVNTTDPDGAGPLIATITNWCGTAPIPFVQNQPNGPEAVVLPLRSLTIVSGNTLRLLGSRPVIIAVDGDVQVDGTIDANADGTTPGAGGNLSCANSQGGDGEGDTTRLRGASGGGGGGFGTAGGRAGAANTDNVASVGIRSGGTAGSVRGTTNLIPLLGGCAGGKAGDCATAGGAGGGAIQITASGSLEINGTVRANGGNGSRPCGSLDEGGGTGGGSGGAILLEATSVDTSGAILQANGGNGGPNGAYAGIYSCGNNSGGSGSTSSGQSGSNSNGCQGGSPGAGGGYGRIRTVTH